MTASLSDTPALNTHSPARRAGLTLVVLLAWALFLAGCIAPLTPSEGQPSLGTIALFVGIPAGLMVIVTLAIRSTGLRLLASTQLVGLLLLAGWVLSISML
jgi:hypothetical protein